MIISRKEYLEMQIRIAEQVVRCDGDTVFPSNYTKLAKSIIDLLLEANGIKVESKKEGVQI